ncbi:hypothetical protein AA313_de0207212 [Arthrobotrys entomopaga]|nr:hypothetical protein AA313_de0207212 [Arthrobotrys entomopaga]
MTSRELQIQIRNTSDVTQIWRWGSDEGFDLESGVMVNIEHTTDTDFDIPIIVTIEGDPSIGANTALQYKYNDSTFKLHPAGGTFILQVQGTGTCEVSCSYSG